MKFSLLPKEEKFFELFEAQAEFALKGAMALLEMAKNFENVSPAVHKEEAAAIKAIEHEGDKITFEVTQRLARTFITPLEREDIHALSSSLDDILDAVEGVASRLVIFQVKIIPPECLKLCEILVSACQSLIPATREISHPSNIHSHCVRVKQLENEADEVSRHATAELFQSQAEARELIKWKELYGRLEAATDACEDAAKVLESIALKNA